MSACASPQGQYISPVIPPELLICSPSPEVPQVGTQRDVALYIVDLHAAHEDCESKLRRLGDLLGGQ